MIIRTKSDCAKVIDHIQYNGVKLEYVNDNNLKSSFEFNCENNKFLHHTTTEKISSIGEISKLCLIQKLYLHRKVVNQVIRNW